MDGHKKEASPVMYWIPKTPETKVLLKQLSDTRQKIIKGSLKETAGTGTLINDLYGNARKNTQYANMGGGSKANGGGGIEAGEELIRKHEAAMAALCTISKIYNAHNLID